MAEPSVPITHPGTAGEPTKRRWRIPPPLMRNAEAPGPEGLYILDDFESELGVVLWKTLRSVALWSQVEPEDREGLFDEEAAERRQAEIDATVPDDEMELRRALEEIVPLLARPHRVDGEPLGLACTRISRWAEGKQAARTALEFIQAAALASPTNARFALCVGRSARDLAQYGRAEAWLYRAVGLSRQVADWETYIRAYLAHGKMLLQRGALPAAERSFLKARRRATRQGLRQFEAMSYHEIFVLETSKGNPERALAFAEEAGRAYGPKHRDFPRLAHDVAYVWMQHGDYEHAFPVFSEVLDRIRPSHRPVVLGSLARAAAGMKDRDAFEWAVDELETAPATAPGVAEAWVEAARGAVILGDYEDAERAARFAERLARKRGEGQVRFMAESVLESAKAEIRAVEARAAASKDDIELAARREVLARSLLRSLTTGTRM